MPPDLILTAVGEFVHWRERIYTNLLSATSAFPRAYLFD